MNRSLVAWSYPHELTPENVERLDVATSNAIAVAITRINNVGEALGASSNGSTSATAAIRAS